VTYFVYILTNASRRPLYTGVTNSIGRRYGEHIFTPAANAYTAQYGLTRLVYFEECKYIRNAIAREKQLKRWNHAKKVALIEAMNPDWDDLGAAIKARGPSTPSARLRLTPVGRDDNRLLVTQKSVEERDAEAKAAIDLLKQRMRQLRANTGGH
jgi:putative endonuclease